MTCPCCQLPSCCPAFRAFDGSDRYYRYLVVYDWDVPTEFGQPGNNLELQALYYKIRPEDGDTAIAPAIDANGNIVCNKFPPGVFDPRFVDGHVVWDAAERCTQYLGATGEVQQPPWPPGAYGFRFRNLWNMRQFTASGELLSAGLPGKAFSNVTGIASVPPAHIMPWRNPSLLNGPMFNTGPIGPDRDRWYPSTNECEFWTVPTVDGAHLVPQNQGRSLVRAELWGEYGSSPSPFCYQNPNPLP